MEEHRSFCRLCMATCGIVVRTEAGQVVEVRGDPDNPLSRGYTCPKGRALGALHHHRDRLDQPALRSGGRLVATDWSRLLDDLGERIAEIVASSGPGAVGMYLATGSAFDAAGRRVAERFIRGLPSPQVYTATTIDTPCKPLVMELMAGHPGLVPLLDWERADFAILVGTNPVVSHGHSNPFPDPVTRLRSVARRGALWVVDPRRTETARLATRHLAPRPGTDAALIGYLVRELLDHGADRDYLGARTAGVEELRRAVAPFTLSAAAERCGLPPDDLTDLVASIRAHGPACAQTGTGTTMAAEANVTEWLVWALNIITRSYDRPGAMWFNPGFFRRLDTRSWQPTDGETAGGPGSRPDLPARYGEYPCAGLVDEIEAGNLRALLVVGGNPVTSFPDPARTAAALAGLEVLAVCDIVSSETVALATHVLACAGQLERADLPLYIDAHLPAVATQYTPAVLAPQADRRPLWWPMAQLGRRLGMDLLRGLDPDATSDDDILAGLANRGMASFDAVRGADGAVVAAPSSFGWVEDRLPGGRWRLAPPQLVDQLRQLEGRRPAVVTTEAASGRPAPTEDQRQLLLVPQRQLRHLNSSLRDGGGPGWRHDAAGVELHPLDAAARGIADGDEVVVRSGAGELRASARLEPGLRPGVVSIPHGFAAPNVGALTTGASGTDPLTGMVRQAAVEVSVVLSGATLTVTDSPGG